MIINILFKHCLNNPHHKVVVLLSSTALVGISVNPSAPTLLAQQKQKRKVGGRASRHTVFSVTASPRFFQGL